MKKIPVRQIATDNSEQRSAETFRMRKVQDLFGGQDLVHELHRHDFYFMLVLQQGKGTHEIDFHPYPVCNHAVYFLRPGQVHQLVLEMGCTGYLLEFNNECYPPESGPSRQRFRKVSTQNFSTLDARGCHKILSILDHIYEEFTVKSEAYKAAILANLDLLFIQLVRLSTHPHSMATMANSYAQTRLEEFLELLETRIKDLKQASQYAQLMHLSLFQLNGITKSAVGKSASGIIHEQLILEAKRNLLATTKQVKDIAYQLGYEDVSYFIRFFKKHTGYAPEAFRQHAVSGSANPGGFAAHIKSAAVIEPIS